MIPTITLPVPLEQIPAEVKRLTDHVNALNAAARATRELISAVRAACPHEKTESGNTWGRDPWTRCLHCGKEW